MDLNVQFYRMSKQMKTQLYLDNLTTIFNPQALFADGTEFYRCPAEPDPYDSVRLLWIRSRKPYVAFVMCVQR